MSNPQLNILISGGGIAGPFLAWWLQKGINARITILERFPAPRVSGQAVDIRDAGVPIIQKMGLEKAIADRNTTEEGLELVYADGVTKATFPATGDKKDQSFTSEFEILRGDLAQILYEETKDTAEWVFDEYITDIQQQESGKSKVTFANHLAAKEYDLVVGADGQSSKTRRLIWGRGPNDGDYFRRLGQYCAYFTIPRIASDTKFAQWYNATKGRLAFTRPDRYGGTRAYLAVTDGDLSRFDIIAKAESKEAQQKWLEEEFEGAGWQTERVVQGMKESKDFYMQEVVQVKMEEFVSGTAALLGDAGYCPSPISGMGTTTAIVGAYILAGELSKSPTDIQSALKQYQSVLRPFIDKVQALGPGTPQIVMPQTSVGVAILNKVAGFAANYWVQKILSPVSGLFSTGGTWKLPEYPELEQR